jgi:hypothetical protein
LKIKPVFSAGLARLIPDAAAITARQDHSDVKTLVVFNDPACGTERSYNGLRLAHALAKRDGEELHVFLLPDAV